jgi:deazaflavin-dependent oxidoreductase (nitroreductase family)
MSTEMPVEHSKPRQPPKLANTIVKWLLRSPLHGSVSKQIMLVTFRGRKSGKLFNTPVGYMREGQSVIFFTDHSWWKNLVNGAPVTLHIQGKKLEGTSQVVFDDKEQIARELQSYIEQRPAAARAYSISLDSNGKADPETVHQAAQRFVLVRVTLQ